jgi:hypothetical protein
MKASKIFLSSCLESTDVQVMKCFAHGYLQADTTTGYRHQDRSRYCEDQAATLASRTVSSYLHFGVEE